MTTSRMDWDAAASSFDDEPDHGLQDPAVLQAWTALLKDWLPAQKSDVLDIGCGTGSLSLVLADLGHNVTGLDFSAAMLHRAQEKAAATGRSITFVQMDAARLALPSASFDALVCRHLLWALPEPWDVLGRCAELLRPGGRLIMVEGFWSTGSGLHAEEIAARLPSSLALSAVKSLSGRADYWGKAVEDERYLMTAVKS